MDAKYMKEWGDRPHIQEKRKAYYQKHKAEIRARVDAYAKAHPEQTARNKRAWMLKHDFGITIEQYDEILKRQGGGCGICGKKPTKRRLAVDHNHKTGKIRGLLDTYCNHRILGNQTEENAILRAKGLIAYLENPPAATLNLSLPLTRSKSSTKLSKSLPDSSENKE